MYGVIHVVAKLFGFIKDTIVDSYNDYHDRNNYKADEVAYVGKDGLRSYSTGHKLTCVDSHTYIDNSTLRTIKVPLSQLDIQREKDSKKKAIEKGYEVYRCCSYYLPDKVKGTVYKSVSDDRLYVRRKIKNTLNNNKHKINGLYYISIMPDNFGYVERGFKGKLLNKEEKFLKDFRLNLEYNAWQNEDFKWEVY